MLSSLVALHMGRYVFSFLCGSLLTSIGPLILFIGVVMKEIAIDIIFWIGVVTSVVIMLWALVGFIYGTYERLMNYDKVFKFVFNLAFDRSIRNTSMEQMDSWLEKCERKWEKYHDKSGILAGRKVKIVNDAIVVSVDIDFLCSTIEMGVGEVEFTDKMGFAKDIAYQLLAEKDDGQTLVTEFFDNAGFIAVENGSASVDLKEKD